MIGITASGGLARYRLGRSKFSHTLQPSPDLGGRKEEIPRPLIAYLGPADLPVGHWCYARLCNWAVYQPVVSFKPYKRRNL